VARWAPGRVPLRAAQKANETDGCPDELVEQLDDNAPVLNALREGRAQVAAGTSWLWARTRCTRPSTFFHDEAGQMCLRMCLAVSQAATSWRAFGDPQSSINRSGRSSTWGRWNRPFASTGRSSTILPEQGLFLSETQRLHPTFAASLGIVLRRPTSPRCRNEEQCVNVKVGCPGPA